ncbi:MAG: ABC transporter substrate-binding protein [Egibacteraceae bacterium]
MNASRSRRLAFLLLAFGVLAAACGSPPSAPDDENELGGGASEGVERALSGASPEASGATSGGGSDATGGTVRIAWGGAPDSLNPGNGVLSEAYSVYELVYDTLIALDLDGKYQPELATDWSVSDDGRTWTVNMVDDAMWSDGEPVTAEDVKYTLELYRDTEDFPYLSAYPDVFSEIEAVDDTTLTITTDKPIGNFESRLVFAYVVPKHIWEAQDDPVAFENAEMIGSGPFTLADYRQGEFAEFAQREDYWGQAPNVDGAIFRTIKNPDARVQALLNGEVDVVSEFPNTAIPTLRGTENVEVVSGDPISPGLRDIIFNMLDPKDCPEGSKCTGHPALRDLEVRQALSKAVDKQQIIDVALLGFGTPGLTLTPVGLGPWFADDVEDYGFDLEAARQQLEAAGYTDTNGDGIRECKPDQDCKDLTFRFNFANDIDTAPREAELVSGWWSDIGVATEIRGVDPDTLTSICCPNFDHDVFIWGWVSDPDPAYLLSAGLCSEIPTGFSETGYCNPEYDALFQQQATETDADKRIEMIHGLQRMLVEDAALVVSYYEETVQAYRTDTFEGWPVDESRLELTDPSALTAVRPVAQ